MAIPTMNTLWEESLLWTHRPRWVGHRKQGALDNIWDDWYKKLTHALVFDLSFDEMKYHTRRHTINICKRWAQTSGRLYKCITVKASCVPCVMSWGAKQRFSAFVSLVPTLDVNRSIRPSFIRIAIIVVCRVDKREWSSFTLHVRRQFLDD